MIKMPPPAHPPQSSKSEMAARFVSTDWSATALGPVEHWPDSLRLALSTCFDQQYPVSIWWGPELIQFYNDDFRAILGSRKHPNAFGQPASESWQEIWSIMEPIAREVLASGLCVKGHDTQWTVERNGFMQTCHFNIAFSPIRDFEGIPGGVHVTLVDTTKRVEAERRLRLQIDLADRLRNLSSVTEITDSACELLGKALNVSRVYYSEIDDNEKIFRVPAKWFAGSELPPLPAARGIADFGQPLNNAIRDGAVFIVDDIIDDQRTADQVSSFLPLSIAAIMLIPIRKTGRISTHINITSAVPRRWTVEEISLVNDVAERTFEAIERARAHDAFQAELENTQRAEAALRTADLRRNEFLAMLAHELRNPLAPINAAADLLATSRLDENRIKSTSKIIARQVTHMTGLIDDLLDVSRVTSGLTKLDKSPNDIRTIVANAVEQVQPLMTARRHRLSVIQAARPAMVSGDRNRLVQVLSNLLNNAAKYTPFEGQVSLCTEIGPETVTLRVADNGIGMVPELVVGAFELFAQAERTPDRSQGGLGLGLALVRSLVELHGGRVTASSAGLGHGSVFTVVLPRLLTSVEPAAPAPDIIALPETGVPLHVLVVDDNVDAANMLAMLVEASGHEVEVQHDPIDALESAGKRAPDVCLLDIGLPGMDGNELARRLRQMPALDQTLLIAVSGYEQQSDGAFDHHFVKPVDSTRLIELLQRAPRLLDATFL